MRVVATLMQRGTSFWTIWIGRKCSYTLYQWTYMYKHTTRVRGLCYNIRCHQIGVYVHYDLHVLAELPDTPSKWELLKKEVQIVMNHPAVAA